MELDVERSKRSIKKGGSMKYLMDTCVISELIKKKPNKNVISWASSKSEENLYLSVLTIGEIQKGISKLAESKKKDELQPWITIDLRDRFSGRILDVDLEIAKKWGELQECRKTGSGVACN